MATGASLIERERRRVASEESKERVYGCARCGRGTIPGGKQAFRVGDKLLSTALRKVPCAIEDEGHKRECIGTMYVHSDERICAIVKKHTN